MNKNDFYLSASVVFDLGVLGHFGTENCTWKLGTIQKSLGILPTFHVWFFWPKMT